MVSLILHRKSSRHRSENPNTCSVLNVSPPRSSDLLEYPPRQALEDTPSAIPPVATRRENVVLTWSRPADATAIAQTDSWPPLIEVLIGVIAGTLPELVYFFWWSFK